ncbi:unnamed protein product [Clonostachys chloroleuca]|uniref:Uncharacterized protein n=1 Tax=Clonostachys chloroleuca TaxID=1926264 RepID=A0AA35Q0U9_9HYPO|nr:unnamed protein product [Clonostachys chloroleuca]
MQCDDTNHHVTQAGGICSKIFNINSASAATWSTDSADRLVLSFERKFNSHRFTASATTTQPRPKRPSPFHADADMRVELASRADLAGSRHEGLSEPKGYYELRGL